MNWERLTPLRIALLLGVLVTALRISSCRYLELVDVRAVDYRLIQRGIQPGSPDIVIVAVDDASLEAVGRWPWPRSIMAQLVERIADTGAAVIGFDIVQSERTANVASAQLPAHVDGVDAKALEAVRVALRKGSNDDALLAEAIAKSGRSVVGYFLDFNRPGAATGDQVSGYNLVHGSKQGRGEARVHQSKAATMNLPEIQSAARERGYFNFIPDDLDGYYRRVPLVLRLGDDMVVPLSLAMLRVVRPREPLSIRFADFGVEAIDLGPVSIPVAEDGQLLINYRGPGKTFRHVSAADVLAGRVPPDVLKDKLVLVGVTATAVADVRATPFDGVFPGVEIHANVLDNILRQDFIQQPKWIVLVEIAVIGLLVLILGLVLQHARGVLGAATAATLIVAYLAGSQWLFVHYGMPLSLVYPLLAIGLCHGSISLQHYVVEERNKRKIRNAFELYLTPAVARIVSERPEMLALGGDTRQLTVLFSDIRGFTTISERFQSDPHTLVALLNDFLGGMTDVIFACDGTLDKYVGDEIMAFWGAPLPQADHAARACRGALGMMARLAQLNEEFHQRGWPSLDIGIGLNSGPMVVGNMGSARRLSYTLVGDNVNLGARLEGLNKLYGSHIIASESTVTESPDFVFRELDLVRVKGKYQGVRIFEVLGPGDERPRWASLVTRFESGLQAYRTRQWDEAINTFGAILEENPNDGPARLYLGRVRGMLDAPPPLDWDGVTVMETK
jgi:adenylate cyclase